MGTKEERKVWLGRRKCVLFDGGQNRARGEEDPDKLVKRMTVAVQSASVSENDKRLMAIKVRTRDTRARARDCALSWFVTENRQP